MDNQSELKNQRYIFGSIFFLKNQLQIIIDKSLAKDGITTQQWYLMAVMEEFFTSPPTLKELAEAMGSSHQNVKQIALKLEQKGFLELNRDPNDGRAIRISQTKKCTAFWAQKHDEVIGFFMDLYQDLSPQELEALSQGLQKLICKVISVNKIGDGYQ